MPYKPDSKEYNLARLNERQRNVASLMLQGLTNKDIAERLDITPQAVSNYINSPLFQAYIKSLRVRVEDAVVSNERMVADLVPKVLGLAHDLVDDALKEDSQMLDRDKINLVKHWTKPFVELPTGNNSIFSDKEIQEYKKRQQKLFLGDSNEIETVEVEIEDVISEEDIKEETKPEEGQSSEIGV